MEGADGLSRAELLLKGALAAGAAYGLGMVAPYARKALAASGGGDADFLNFVLGFEHILVALYEKGQAEPRLSDELQKLIGTLLDEERQHVEAVIAEVEKLGAKPVPPGDYGFAFRAESWNFRRMAGYIERATIGAYNGGIPTVESKDLRAFAGSIVQVEGRHAAALRLQSGRQDPAPKAFDYGMSEYQARSSVIKYTGPIS